MSLQLPTPDGGASYHNLHNGALMHSRGAVRGRAGRQRAAAAAPTGGICDDGGVAVPVIPTGPAAAPAGHGGLGSRRAGAGSGNAQEGADTQQQVRRPAAAHTATMYTRIHTDNRYMCTSIYGIYRKIVDKTPRR